MFHVEHGADGSQGVTMFHVEHSNHRLDGPSRLFHVEHGAGSHSSEPLTPDAGAAIMGP